MSQTVDRAFVHAYTSLLHRLSAQRESKLRSSVRVEMVTGKAYHFERLGASDLVNVTTRHMATPLLNPEHSRRRVVFTDRAGGILLDKLDEPKMLISPESDYARNHADSVNRFYDDLVIEAAFGSATTVSETDATGTAAFASANQIAAGGTGFTFAKANQAVRILNDNDVPQDGRYGVISPQGLEDLLAETTVTSSDFSDLSAIKNGTFEGKKWMGMTWIVSTRLPRVSTTRSCLVYHRDGLGLAINKEMDIDIDRRPDLLNSLQVLAQVSAGAVRIEEALCVQVDITET